MAFNWHVNDGSTFNVGLVALSFFQGVWTRIAMKSYIFCDFFRWVGAGVPIDHHMVLVSYPRGAISWSAISDSNIPGHTYCTVKSALHILTFETI